MVYVSFSLRRSNSFFQGYNSSGMTSCVADLCFSPCQCGKPKSRTPNTPCVNIINHIRYKTRQQRQSFCNVVLPGPPCDETAETCFENSKCDALKNVCVCDDFFVMSGDWTKCMPVAVIPFESECEDNSQCSARMGQGAVCSAASTCECKDGFHYLHGVCHKSSGYGEICDQDDDCYGAFSYESLSCVENKCSCSDGYYLVGPSYCRRMGKVDEECVFDMDCQFVGGYCNENKCAVKAKGNQHVFSSSGNSVFQHSADFSERFPTTKLGDACETSDECLAATNNTECYGKVCVCELGFSRFGNLCKPDLGEFCSEEGKLDYIEEAECRGNILRCKAPYIITRSNKMCRPGRQYGQQCQVPEQCMFSGDHAVCVAVGNRMLCQCADGYHLVGDINLCLESKGISEQCDHSYECVVTSGNVDCVDSACTCLKGFHATKGDCVRDVVALTDPCLDTTDCTSVIAYSSCVSSKCQCNRGYFADLTTNTSCLTGIGGPCTEDSDCDAISSSFCKVTVCACDNGTIPNTENNKCLKVADVFGDECEEDSQCNKALGSEGSACLEGICACEEDYHFRNDLCRNKRVLGEPCEQNSQCYLESKETHKIECRNGICQCGYAYTQTHDLDCKSGVSGRSAYFELVIGALMGFLLRQTKWN